MVEFSRTRIPTTSITTDIATISIDAAGRLPSLTSWEALGCYNDTSGVSSVKRMNGEEGDTDLTISDCQDTCYFADMKFTSVTGGNQCRCNSFVPSERVSNQSDCNIPCSGDKNEICGGIDRLNIFKVVYGTDHVRATSTSGAGVSKGQNETSSSKEGKVLETQTAKSGTKKYRALF